MRRPYPLVLVFLLAGCTQAGPIPLPSPSASVSVSAAPTCPADGLRVELGTGDAAAGLRVLDFFLVNCGTAAAKVNGYPGVRLLDEQRRNVSVNILQGTYVITGPVPDWNKPPREVVLKPGERVTAVVAWRSTYDNLAAPPVNAAFLEITPTAGGTAQVLTPRSDIDLGSTGRIGVSSWQPILGR
ncbi:hypothetical protein BJ973_003792 [Actinoplanes tereljensis]|uniref:DUF4232 domain-containing protein n=1 Tax=Paractinoplanes tereljensis TaxID=571912 RepID=A0A919NWG4_9ACTN|nr:DUF4232 domain-containing protein [Actinoplanes tereljensis]GIF25515.1 hypothetical protein Ate02nite_82450 [Actinoplanes tereljensis]